MTGGRYRQLWHRRSQRMIEKDVRFRLRRFARVCCRPFVQMSHIFDHSATAPLDFTTLLES